MAQPANPASPPCASCGRPSSYVAQYGRYYCFPCSRYVDLPAPPPTVSLPSSSLPPAPVIPPAPVLVPSPFGAPPAPSAGLGAPQAVRGEIEIGVWDNKAGAGYGIFGVGIFLCAFTGGCVLFAGLVIGDAGTTAVGAIVFLLTFVFVYLGYRRAHTTAWSHYVLTSRRALVYRVENKIQTLVQSCYLAQCQVEVLNRKVVSQFQTTGAVYGGGGGAFVGTTNATTTGTSGQIGDVLFLIGGVPQVKFLGVRDPDGILSTANHIIQGLRGSVA